MALREGGRAGGHLQLVQEPQRAQIHGHELSGRHGQALEARAARQVGQHRLADVAGTENHIRCVRAQPKVLQCPVQTAMAHRTISTRMRDRLALARDAILC